MFETIKTYGHERGFSCAFRQHSADSHCRFIHGYALKFEFTFRNDEGLDERNWIQDFGQLKALDSALREHFDHKTVISESDPELDSFIHLSKINLIKLVVIPEVSCERFAELASKLAATAIYGSSTYIHKVQCWEHFGNSATFYPNK